MTRTAPPPADTGEPTDQRTMRQRWEEAVMQTYAVPPLTLVRGEGCTVWDSDGRAYLDLLAGIAVNVLGHGHPALRAAVDRQLATLGHVSNLYVTEPAVALAERLLALLGGTEPTDGRVFFANSGAEANEAAFKLARAYGGADRPELVAAEGAFHGRTMGALALTGQPAKRAPFEPLPGPVRFVPYGDVDALAAAVTGRTAAVFLEPVLGEGGVVPPPAGYLAAARALTADRGALLVLDEVQTGIGRTGAWFAHQHDGIRPDVVTLAKGLAGGLPIGACIGLGPAATVLRPGMHGSTFGGNPVCAAAALAVLDTVAAEGLVERAGRLGARLVDGLTAIRHPLLAGVRGRGLLLALVLHEPVAGAVERAARTAGFLVGAVSPTAVRIAPPLVLSDADADRFLSAVPSLLARVADGD